MGGRILIMKNFADMKNYFNSLLFPDITEHRCSAIFCDQGIYYRLSAFSNEKNNSASLFCWILYVPKKNRPTTAYFCFDGTITIDQIRNDMITELDINFKNRDEKHAWAAIGHKSFRFREALQPFVKKVFSIIRNEYWFDFIHNAKIYHSYVLIDDPAQKMKIYISDEDHRCVNIELLPDEIDDISGYLSDAAERLVRIKENSNEV